MKSKKRLEMGEEEWKEYQIERNRIKSRECQRRRSVRNRIFFNGKYIRDITGVRSGMIVAKRPVPPEEYGNTDVKSIYWECECDCGGKIIARSSRVYGGEYKSCGCMRRNGTAKRNYTLRDDRAKINEFYGDINVSYFNSIKNKAEKRKMEFSVTIQYLDEVFKRQNGLCIFIKEKLIFKNGAHRNETTASLDRINSSIGYVEGNLQWVHKDVNMLKGRMRDESLIKFCIKYEDIIKKIVKMASVA